MGSYLSSLLCKLLLCDFTTRVTVRCVLTFTVPTSYKREIHWNLPQAESSYCLIIYINYVPRQLCAVKNIIFLLHVSKAPANRREANPTLLFCCVVCLVRQQQHWSQWRKQFVLFLKPLKLTSSKGGDVMWNEWLLFLSNFMILAWNLISYPIPIREHPPLPPPFFLTRAIW